jgi:hypothetical protein
MVRRVYSGVKDFIQSEELKQAKKKISYEIFAFFGVSFLFIVLLSSAVRFAKEKELDWFPVIEADTVSFYDVELQHNSAISFRVKFHKVRDCEYVPEQDPLTDFTMYGVRSDGVLIKGYGDWKDPVTTRPEGVNVTGEAFVQFAVDITKIDYFFLYVQHDCGLPWITRTRMGRLHLPENWNYDF